MALPKLASRVFAGGGCIQEHRGLYKLKGAYTDKLAHLRAGRVHTHYAQVAAVTGRLSSNAQNLQNIPVKTAEGKRVCEAFVAPAGSLIVSACTCPKSILQTARVAAERAAAGRNGH